MTTKLSRQQDTDASEPLKKGSEGEEEALKLGGFKTYAVEYSEGYEPFIICSRRDLPLFDERFRGACFCTTQLVVAVFSDLAEPTTRISHSLVNTTERLLTSVLHRRGLAHRLRFR